MTIRNYEQVVRAVARHTGLAGEAARRTVDVTWSALISGLVATPGQLYAAVAAELGIEPGAAMEQAQAACHALVDAGDGDELRALVGPGLAELMEPSPAHPEHHGGGQLGAGSSLSTGRPGSAHPLSEAGALPGAHEQSVARTDNPHGDRKLSSTQGPETAPPGHSLAEGAPGSDRPISENE